MAGEATLNWALQVLAEGEYFTPPGAQSNWSRTWKTNGGKPPMVFPFKIPKRTAVAPYPDPVLIYSYQWAPNPSFLACVLTIPATEIELAEFADKPVSSTDITPAGTHEHGSPHRVSWNSPYMLNCIKRLVHPTLASACGVNAQNKSIILTDGGSVEGRVYEWQAVTLNTAKDILGFVMAVE